MGRLWIFDGRQKRCRHAKVRTSSPAVLLRPIPAAELSAAKLPVAKLSVAKLLAGPIWALRCADQTIGVHGGESFPAQTGSLQANEKEILKTIDRHPESPHF